MTFPHPFYFLRHGQTDWNASGRTQGQLDSQLDATGRTQAKRAAEILRGEPVARIVASPLARARHTAEAVAEAKGLEVILDEGLMECHLGEHQGGPHGPWLAEYWAGAYDPPGGERFEDFAARVWEAMARAVALGPDTLIVAHGGLWLAAQLHVRVTPDLARMPNALPLRVTPEPTLWRHETLDPEADLSDAPPPS
jgi:broad specificity phosphatase PhoE